MGCPPGPRLPAARTAGSPAPDGGHTDAKGQAGDRPARGTAQHPQGISPGRTKPWLTLGSMGLFNSKIRKLSENGQRAKEPEGLQRMPKFAPTEHTMHPSGGTGLVGLPGCPSEKGKNRS